MKTFVALSRVALAVLSSTVVLACSTSSAHHGASPSAPPPAAPVASPPPTSPSVVGPVIEAKVVLTLQMAGAAATTTDEQALAIFKNRCATCHNGQSAALWDLSVLPAATQLEEIEHRISLDAGTPGHMPMGGALPDADKAQLSSWLTAAATPPAADPFADYQLAAQETDGAVLPTQRIGAGRYAIELGKRAKGQAVRLALTLTDAGHNASVTTVDAVLNGDDGTTYKTVTVDPRAATRPAATGTTTATVTAPTTGTGTSTTAAVAAHLSLHLIANGSSDVGDAQALAVLQANCQGCHNPQNPPRWDLSVLPPQQYWSEIARRISLNQQTIGHMPMGGSLAARDLATLTQWLAQQQNPADEFAGYALTATDAATHSTLVAAPLSQGRTSIDLGQRQVGAVVAAQVIVTGADGVAETIVVHATVAADGSAVADVPVRARDTSPPAVADGGLTAADLTASSVIVSFKAATDDRPATDLVYAAYQSESQLLDSVDQVKQNGTLIGDGLTPDHPLTFTAVGLAADHVYYFNVIVRDRTGNASVYQKLQVRTLPSTLCPEITQAGGVQAWRDQLAAALQQGTIAGSDATQQINRCFPNGVPQCAQRTLDYAQRDDVADAGSDGSLDVIPEKRPPDEIKDVTVGKYWIPDNIEQIAKDKGWTAVRYKSRHAGGFDSGTPNLLMVYVPGDKVNPPVKFDRWLNFPLPKDDDEPPLGQPQHPHPKFGPPKREQYAIDDSTFPSTFTMVSQDRADGDQPATVYFQMFERTSGTPSFTPSGPVNIGGCVSCHPNGLRAISPLGYHVRDGEERLSDTDWKAVEFINRMMVQGAGFKAARWGEGTAGGVKKPLYRAERGPIIGPAAPVNGMSRTKEFIMGGTLNGQQLDGCYNRQQVIDVQDIFGRAPGSYLPEYEFQLAATPQIDPSKVIAAMGSCEGCHVNGQRWPLNDATDFSQVEFKILVDQSMPLGMHLNPLDASNASGHVIDELTGDERFALVNCLSAEFDLEQQNLTKWLTQASCQQ